MFWENIRVPHYTTGNLPPSANYVLCMTHVSFSCLHNTSDTGTIASVYWEMEGTFGEHDAALVGAQTCGTHEQNIPTSTGLVNPLLLLKLGQLIADDRQSPLSTPTSLCSVDSVISAGYADSRVDSVN